MATQSELKEVGFKKGGYSSENMEIPGCGYLPCDHSEIVTVPETGEEYRWCNKLWMRVSDDDTCKYHQSKKWDKLISLTAEVYAKEYRAINKKSDEQEAIPVFRLILVAVFCAALFWLLK